MLAGFLSVPEEMIKRQTALPVAFVCFMIRQPLEERQTIMSKRAVFITGGSGFMGRNLIPELLRRGHEVRALARPGSESKLPQGCTILTGDPFDRESFAKHTGSSDTFIQLVGVAHPSPAKAKEFRRIDLKSAIESVAAASIAGVEHFIYVSVAQ